MSASIELPKYKCHKEVWALKLESVSHDGTGLVNLTFENKRYAPIVVDLAWLDRFNGNKDDYGYYVIYADGYESWSPTKAFEEGYSLV
jgi:hypothetical protein